MADQKYKSKSFVISFMSHKGDLSSNAPYVYKVIDGKNFEASILFPLLKEGLSSEIDSEKETAQKSPLFQSSSDNNEGIWFKVRIVVHSHKDFSIGQVSNEDDVASFAQDFFYDPTKIGSEANKENEYLPIVHITLDNNYVSSLFSNKGKLPKHLSRSFQILDSSIWNKIVPFIKNETFNVGGTEGLYDTISEIDNYYQRGLYNLQVSHEYANLSARLAKQAYLSGAHASGVSPFIFHSETTANHLIQREFRLRENAGEVLFNIEDGYEIGSVLNSIFKHKWRILLLDDKAVEPMDIMPNIPILDKNKGGRYCKLQIIRDVLEHQLGLEEQIAFSPCYIKETKDGEQIIEKKANDNTKILIEYAQNIDEAEKSLQRKKYDIVLLDYFLNQEDGTHYGYELLEKIFTDQETNKNCEDCLKYKTIKPHHHLRMYCMFISAYSSAVHDRLLAEGLNQSEKYWFINLGACPTNTPKLFLYNLLKLMDKRLDDSHIRRLSINNIVEVLEDIYKDDYIRRNAGDYYQKIQSLQYYYRNLLQDYDISVGKKNIFETTKSVLVTHFFNDHINMGGLLEHLAQLVHLTAFGTIRQWPEMWEEYLYVKAQLESQLFFEDDKKKLSKLCYKIEGYILKLKSSAL